MRNAQNTHHKSISYSSGSSKGRSRKGSSKKGSSSKGSEKQSKECDRRHPPPDGQNNNPKKAQRTNYYCKLTSNASCLSFSEMYSFTNPVILFTSVSLGCSTAAGAAATGGGDAAAGGPPPLRSSPPRLSPPLATGRDDCCGSGRPPPRLFELGPPRESLPPPCWLNLGSCLLSWFRRSDPLCCWNLRGFRG